MPPPWPGPAPHQQDGRPVIPTDANLNDPAVEQYRDFLDWFTNWREWLMTTPYDPLLTDIEGLSLDREHGGAPGVERGRESAYSLLPDHLLLPDSSAAIMPIPHRQSGRDKRPPTDVVPGDLIEFEDGSSYIAAPGAERDVESDVRNLDFDRLDEGMAVAPQTPAEEIDQLMQEVIIPAIQQVLFVSEDDDEKKKKKQDTALPSASSAAQSLGGY